ncbi:MAG: methyltransferase domain-containing protein [Planctomycetes bacterium]|nr:methyltransferase domain-containing protein [Planctomycetota bacterium]
MPRVGLKQLETLWFQLTGTMCNLQCTHCFISCGPKNKTHEMLTTDTVRWYLKEASTLKVKEYYFTGGEPFLHPQLADIIKETLNFGPATILSNGTLITQEVAHNLNQISRSSRHKLGFRISLESSVDAENDRIRGHGSFQKAVKGTHALLHAGFNPIITTADWAKHGEVIKGTDEEFMALARSLNAPQLKLKKLPLVLLGRCAELIRPYSESERVTGECFDDFDINNLQCASSRIVTSKGVFVCPILINDPKAWMGWTLKESFVPYTMESPACYTCRISGLTCKNNDLHSYETGVPENIKDIKTIRKDTVRKSVNKFYADAAIQPKKELCCPTTYDSADLSHIPQDILNISYGCGSPVTLAQIESGESVLDLGSGGGVDCFIASKIVGEKGCVIGVDMTEEMLGKADASRGFVAKKLGFDNVRFIKGFLEEIPLANECIDVVTSNCVINLSGHKEKVFQEIFRILRNGGRFVISDIFSDREVPASMKQDNKLWSECISGAITEVAFVNTIKAIGFYGLEVINRYFYKVVEGYQFHSITVKAYKYKKSKECMYIGQYATYKGPFSFVSDDDGHTYFVGIPVEVCTDTAWKLLNPPYKGMFTLSDGQNIDVEKPCGPKCC